MKCGIVVNGYYKGAASLNQIERLKEEGEKIGLEMEIYHNRTPVSTDTTFDFDCALFLDKDVALASLLEKKGIKIFNNAKCIEVTDDKAKTAIALSGENIKQQKTVFKPKMYGYVKDDLFLEQVGLELGFPLVVKETKGSLGEQVYLIKDLEELKRTDERLSGKDVIYQKFREKSKGKSYRIIVMGGKVLGAMLLENDNDFRSNAHEGGRGKAVTPKKEWTDAAVAVAKTLNADYVGVDLFYDEPVVIEANGNAFFGEFEKITGINVAGEYVKYIKGKFQK